MRSLEHLRRSLSRGYFDRTRFEQSLIQQQLHLCLHVVRREIGNAGIDGPLPGILRIRPRIQRDDAHVVRSFADAMINQRQRFVLEFIQLRHCAIAKQMNLGAALVAHERLAHPERGNEPRRPIRTGAGLERPAQRGLLACRGLFDFSVSAGLQDDHLIVAGQAVHPFQRFRAGLLEPRRAFISGLHGCRGIKDHNTQLGGLGLGLEKRPRERQNGQRQQNDLQDQQPILPQPLKRRTGLCLGQKPLPEQSARNQLHHALALQKVEKNHDRNCGRKRQRCWCEKVHSVVKSEVRKSKAEGSSKRMTNDE